jgi:hypothetical protein
LDVRIGIIQTAKELDIELDPAARREEVLASIEKALADSAAVLWLTDKRGRRIGVPSSRVAYVEIGETDERRVGFGAR